MINDSRFIAIKEVGKYLEIERSLREGEIGGKVFLLDDFSVLSEELVAEFNLSHGGAVFPPPAPRLTTESEQNSVALSISGEGSSYEIYRSTKSGFDISKREPLTVTSSQSYTDSKDLVAGRKYYYRAVAVSSDGKRSNPSGEKSGQLETNYRITGLEEIQSDVTAYDLASLSGRLETVQGTPVPDADVTVSIPNIEFTVDNVATDSEGRFQLEYRVPGEPGSYSLDVLARPEEGSRNRTVSVDVQPRPEWGRDLKVSELSVEDSLTRPGGTLKTGATVINRGDVDEAATLIYELTDRGGTTILERTREFSLEPGENRSVTTDLSLPSSLSNGSYQLKTSVKNGDRLDEEYAGNVRTADIYIQSASLSNPIYSTAKDTIQGVGTTTQVDSRAVTLLDFSSSSVTFEVDGEETPPISLDTLWTSGSGQFLLLPKEVNTTDSTVTFRAGATTNTVSMSPTRLQGRRGNEASFQVSVPEGQTLDPSTIAFVLGEDARRLQQWDDSAGDELLDARTAQLSLRVGAQAELRDYEGWLRWKGESGVFYKRAAVRPRPIHDLSLPSSERSVESTLKTDDTTIPDFIPGVVVDISGVLENRGDFLEAGSLEVKVEHEGDLIYSERRYHELPARKGPSDSAGGTNSFKFSWPTVGLETGDYTITVQRPKTTDETPGDNAFSRTITLRKPPKLDVKVQKASNPYEVGDQVPVRVFVGRGSQALSGAAVAATLTRPNGTKDGLTLTYDSQSQTYTGSFYANYGGNFRLRARAELSPYRPNRSEELFAQTYVNVTTRLSTSEVDVAESTPVHIRVSNVGGLFGISADVAYNAERVGFVQAGESAFLSEGGIVQTSLQQNDRGGKVVTGITRIDAEDGVTSSQGGRLLSASFMGQSAGQAPFSLDNVTLVDAEGKAMATRTRSDTTVLSVEENPAALSASVRDTVRTSAVRDTAQINLTNADRVKGVEGKISFPASQIDVLNVVEEQTLSERGDAKTLLAKNIDNVNGTVQFGVTRQESEEGVSVGSAPIVSLVYEPQSPGSVPFAIEGGTVISSYESLALPRFTLNDTLSVTGLDGGTEAPTTKVGFDPDTTDLARGDTLETALTVSKVEQLYSFGADVTFASDQLSFLEVEEGRFLSESGDVKTSLSYTEKQGKVVLGLSRLNEDAGGVSTTGKDTLCTMRFRRAGTEPTNIGLANLGLLRPDGSTTISVADTNSLAVEATTTSSPTTETSLAVWPLATRPDLGTSFRVAVTVADVDDLFTVATDVTYDVGSLTFEGASEGDALSEDGAVSTSFTTQVDRESGTIVVGHSRVGSEVGGVSISERDTLFTLMFSRDGAAPSKIDLVNTGLLKPDGETRIPFREYESTVVDTAAASVGSQIVESDGTYDFGPTGVDVFFTAVESAGEITVQRYDSPPADTTGIAASNLSQSRFVIESENSLTFGSSTEVRVAASTIEGVSDPGNVEIYKRSTAGSGAFEPLETSVDDNGTPNDATDDEITATTASFSEFVLASDTEPLPVELTRLDAQAGEDRVRLQWRTASETNNAGFQIKRASTEGEFRKIGFVEGAGTTSNPQTYSFVDENLPFSADTLVYQLKQIDVDGSPHLSREVTVSLRSPSSVRLIGTYPNPASQRATVRFTIPESQEVAVRLYDVLGRQVREVVSRQEEGRHDRRIDLSGLSSGMYVLRLVAGEKTLAQKLTVVR